MNWQCPRCETFNAAAVKYCEVCEFAKPPRKAALKTATRESGLAFVKPPDKTGNGLAAQPLETIKPVSKVTDRRSVGATTKPAEAKPVTSKPSAPPTPVFQSTGRTVIDILSWLALLGGNGYLLYDYVAVRGLGIGSVLLGMVFGNLILLVIIGAISELLKWLLNPPDSTA